MNAFGFPFLTLGVGIVLSWKGAWRTVLMLTTILIVGCESVPDKYEVVPVRGILTYKGEPIANAMVYFTPHELENRIEGVPGQMASGKTDEAGRFTLTTYEKDDGTIIGLHLVTASTGSDKSSGDVLALPWEVSIIKIKVEAGMGEIKVDLD